MNSLNIGNHLALVDGDGDGDGDILHSSFEFRQEFGMQIVNLDPRFGDGHFQLTVLVGCDPDFVAILISSHQNASFVAAGRARALFPSTLNHQNAFSHQRHLHILTWYRYLESHVEFFLVFGPVPRRSNGQRTTLNHLRYQRLSRLQKFLLVNCNDKYKMFHVSHSN